MAHDKATFLKNVIVLHDTREQENKHIISSLEALKVKHELHQMDFGDYSFKIDNRCFSLSCVIERKASVGEFYGNITNDRERIEKEFLTGSNMANEFILLIEQCTSMDTLSTYEVPDWEMKRDNRKVKNIGEYCYSTIQSWQSGNRYKFRTLFVKDNSQTAIKMLEAFYWFWRNYKKLIANRRNRAK